MSPWARIPSEQMQFDLEEPVQGRLRAGLASWFREALGREVSDLTRRTGGGGGFKSTIYFAAAGGEEFVIRVPHPGTGWSARLIGSSPDYHSVAGAYAVGRLRALGQPVPELVAVEQNPGVFGGPFAVWRGVRGVHMADYSEDWAEWPYPEEQWGEFLRACHSIEPVHGAGPVDDEGIGLCTSWREYVGLVSAAHVTTNADCLPSGFAADWDSVLRHYAPLLDSRPVRLLHMESNGYCNLILDPDTHRIAAVLDFEEVLAGDPLFEIVSMAWYLGRRGIADHGGRTGFSWPRFLREYGAVEWDSPLVPIYRAVILLEKLWREDRQSRARGLLRIVRRLRP